MNRRYFVKLFVTIVCFYLLIISASVWAEQEPSGKRLIRLDDLYMTDTPYASILSPVDPQRAVFGRYWLDKATKTEHRSLWLAEDSIDNVRPLEAGEPDGRRAIFSPDGKWIAFLSTRPRPSGFNQTPQVPLYSEPAVDIWLIPATGGTAIPLAGPNKPYGRVFNDWIYCNVAFSPDGKGLVFAADDGKDPRTPEEIEADVYIVRLDKGEGYTGYGPSQIWVAYLNDEPNNFAASRIERLTNDEQWYGEPQWSPDGDTIVVHAFRNYNIESGPLFNQNYDLLAIDVESHSVRALTSGPGAEVSPRFSPDGKRIAYLSVPRKGPHFDIFNIAIVSLNDGQPTTKVIFDHHGSGADNPPHPPAWYRLPGNCWLGPNHLIYKALMGTKSKTILLDLRTGKGIPIGDSDANPHFSQPMI